MCLPKGICTDILGLLLGNSRANMSKVWARNSPISRSNTHNTENHEGNSKNNDSDNMDSNKAKSNTGDNNFNRNISSTVNSDQNNRGDSTTCIKQQKKVRKVVIVELVLVVMIKK